MELTPYFTPVFIFNVAHLMALYKCLEMNFGAITVYLIYHFPKG